MGVYVVLLAAFLGAEDPGFTIQFYTPQTTSAAIPAGTSWSTELLVASRNLVAASRTDPHDLIIDGGELTDQIHRNYRASVARDYVVVTFHGPPVSPRIKTEDGERDVSQIVIGLKRPDGQKTYEVDTIYTIDETNPVLHQQIQNDAKKREAFIRALRAIVPTKSK